jgi:hypothetical protein
MMTAAEKFRWINDSLVQMIALDDVSHNFGGR